jgi:hypothetical protein
VTAEESRLDEARIRKSYWQRWGPYLSERAWGAVREDYSANGAAWEHLPHRPCAILKELYFYLNSTPTHSFMKNLYKYPQAAFPHQQLIEGNLWRGRNDPEFELADTGAFADNGYFEILAEYSKSDPEGFTRSGAWKTMPNFMKRSSLPTEP